MTINQKHLLHNALECVQYDRYLVVNHNLAIVSKPTHDFINAVLVDLSKAFGLSHSWLSIYSRAEFVIPVWTQLAYSAAEPDIHRLTAFVHGAYAGDRIREYLSANWWRLMSFAVFSRNISPPTPRAYEQAAVMTLETEVETIFAATLANLKDVSDLRVINKESFDHKSQNNLTL